MSIFLISQIHIAIFFLSLLQVRLRPCRVSVLVGYNRGGLEPPEMAINSFSKIETKGIEIKSHVM